jgi:hypothetical protein
VGMECTYAVYYMLLACTGSIRPRCRSERHYESWLGSAEVIFFLCLTFATMKCSCPPQAVGNRQGRPRPTLQRQSVEIRGSVSGLDFDKR